MKFFVFSTVALVALLLSGCSGSSDANDGVTKAAALNDYAPATVDRLMESCLSGGESVSACTCLLDAYRRRLDEASLSSDDAARDGIWRSNAERCGLWAAPVASAVPAIPAPIATTGVVRAQTLSTSTSQASAPADPAPPQVSRVPTAGTTRAVASDSPDACLQDKLAAAEKTGSVPIEAFERFQRECGF
jgi:hypothetical protein